MASFKDSQVLIFPQTDFQEKTVVDPSDLDIFTPHGTGVYGYQNNQIKTPFDFAPIHEPAAGMVFFDSSSQGFKDNLKSLFTLLDINDHTKDYYVIIKDSPNPKEDGYIQQVRVLTDFAMKFMFKLKDSEIPPKQPFNIPDLLYYFTQAEIERWGSDCFQNKGLWGMFGGDGHMAKEKLSFGFMVENNYFGAYRIWSRAWLVTK